MGLDIYRSDMIRDENNDDFVGSHVHIIGMSYSAFHRLRAEICRVAGLGLINKREGFADRGGLPWPDRPLTLLLHHSDCDGELETSALAGIANELEALLPSLGTGGGGHLVRDGGYAGATRKLIDGFRAAAAAGETILFS